MGPWFPTHIVALLWLEQLTTKLKRCCAAQCLFVTVWSKIRNIVEHSAITCISNFIESRSSRQDAAHFAAMNTTRVCSESVNEYMKEPSPYWLHARGAGQIELGDDVRCIHWQDSDWISRHRSVVPENGTMPRQIRSAHIQNHPRWLLILSDLDLWPWHLTF